MVDHPETARELEAAAAIEAPRARRVLDPTNLAHVMLARRGFHVTPTRLDLPFDPDLEGEAAERLIEALRHYAFRLFLRGVIRLHGDFSPDEATRYLDPAQARFHAESMVSLGLAARAPEGRYRLLHKPNSFGSTLEWFVARELERGLGFDVVLGAKFHAPGVGGDLDVVAAAEGRIVYLELKSSPPKHVSEPEVTAFLDRVSTLRPHVSIFAVDTALRLSDKVIPMMEEALARRRGVERVPARCVERELWAFSPHLYAVNARPDLVANIEGAIARGLLALGPEPY